MMAEVEFKLVATFVPRDDPSFPPCPCPRAPVVESLGGNLV